METEKTIKPTIKLEDVARKARLSVSTVSRALNNHESVSLETRNRVQIIARDLGYRSANNANISLQNIVAICIPFPDEYGLRNPYFSEIIRGAYMVFRRLEHWHLIVEDIQRISEIRTLVRGLVAVSPDDAGVTFEDPGHLPVVVVDSEGPASSVSVMADNLQGMATATDHVILLGHRVVAYVGPAKTKTATERLQGFQQALAVHGLDPLNIVTTLGSSFEDGYQACANLWEGSHTPTAVIAFNDYMAMGALTFLQSRGIRVPEDVSVVGYDGISQLPIYGLTKLTTMDQHAFEQGYTAANLLVGLISHHRPSMPIVRITPHLVIGGSTTHPSNIVAAMELED